MYQVVSGQALHNICQAATQQQQDGSSCLSLTAWTLIFSASQLLLVLLPDVSNLSSIAAVGAATSLGYAALATIGAAVHGVLGRMPSLSLQPTTAAKIPIGCCFPLIALSSMYPCRQ